MVEGYFQDELDDYIEATTSYSRRNKMEIRDGMEVVINGMWYVVEGDEEDGYIFITDQDGGSREVSVDQIDHIY